MTSLHVDQRDADLRHAAGAVEVRCQDGRIQRVPLAQLSRLTIHSEATVSVGLLRQLSAAGIALLITAGRSRGEACMLWPHAGDARRRLAQYRSLATPASCLAWAKLVVRLKVHSQRRVLRRARLQRPDLRYPLTRGIKLLGGVLAKAASATELSALRGIEGVAARIYFGVLRHLFAPSLGFVGRRRRPPTDPVNACLSLGYTLLMGRALDLVHSAGLDAALGALHDPAYNRPSAACDLMELERWRIEWRVYRLFAEQSLTAEHFGRTADACLLGKAGRPVFFAAIEPELRLAEKRMRRSLYRAIQQLEAAP